MATPASDRVESWVWSHRNTVGPIVLAGVLWLVTAVLAVLGWWWVGAIGGGILWVLGVHAATEQPSRAEKFLCGLGWSAGLALLVGGTTVWRPWDTAWLVVCAVTVLVCGIPWAWHNRVRRGVEVDRAIPAWGNGEAVGLPGTTARGTRADRDGFSFRVSANEKGRLTSGSVRGARTRIAALFDVQVDAVSFAATKSEGEVIVTVREGERRLVEAELSTDPVPITGEHRIGTTDGGDPMLIALHQDVGVIHGAAVGATRSGKSGLVNRVAELVARAPDAVLWVSDLSEGAQELKQWAAVADWFATSPPETHRMILAATALAKDRGRRATARVHVPSAQEPIVYMLMDEAASIFAPNLTGVAPGMDMIRAKQAAQIVADDFEQGVRQWSKHGIGAFAVTQYGDVTAFASGAARDQLSMQRFVFRCAKDLTGHLLMPAGMGASASSIPSGKQYAGTCFADTYPMDGLAKGRVQWMTDDHILATVSRWQGRQPRIEHLGQHAMGDAYRDRERVDPGDVPDPEPAVVVPEQGQGRRTRAATPEESRRAVLDALRDVQDPRVGATVAAVAARCGKSPETVRNRLAELRDEGLVSGPKGLKHPKWVAFGGPR